MVSALKDSQVSVRLPTELRDSVTRYSEITGRSKSHVVMEALAEYLHWRVPQTADLEAAIAAADAGEFAGDAEVGAVFVRYGAAAKGSVSGAAVRAKRPAAPRKVARRAR